MDLNHMGREHVRIEIERLEALLAGQEVDGLRLGDNGLDAAWIVSAIADRKRLLRGR